MDLTPSQRIDIHDRFKDELKQQNLPAQVRLHGNAMQVHIANRLLLEHSETQIAPHAEAVVELSSMENFGAKFVESFLESTEPPQYPRLFYSIPEAELINYAKQHNIPVSEEEKSDVRLMLEQLAAQQPQTFFSLSKSAQRLRNAAELLRKKKQK